MYGLLSVSKTYVTGLRRVMKASSTYVPIGNYMPGFRLDSGPEDPIATIVTIS